MLSKSVTSQDMWVSEGTAKLSEKPICLERQRMPLIILSPWRGMCQTGYSSFVLMPRLLQGRDRTWKSGGGTVGPLTWEPVVGLRLCNCVSSTETNQTSAGIHAYVHTHDFPLKSIIKGWHTYTRIAISASNKKLFSYDISYDMTPSSFFNLPQSSYFIQYWWELEGYWGE